MLESGCPGVLKSLDARDEITVQFVLACAPHSQRNEEFVRGTVRAVMQNPRIRVRLLNWDTRLEQIFALIFKVDLYIVYL